MTPNPSPVTGPRSPRDLALRLLLSTALSWASTTAAGAALIDVGDAVEIDGADGTCSLIEALENLAALGQPHLDCAGADGSDDRLRLVEGGTYVVKVPYAAGANGLPSIDQDVTIRGRGATIVRAVGTATPDFRLMSVSSHLRMFNLTLGNGSTPSQGGALRVSGAGLLECDECRFLSNSAGGGGGAVWLESTDAEHVFVASRFHDNETAGGIGGAVACTSGRVDFERSLLQNNRNAETTDFLGGGGALALRDCRSIILQSALLDNSAVGARGGAILVRGDSIPNEIQIRVISSTLSGNRATAGGAIFIETDDGIIDPFTGSIIVSIELSTITLNDASNNYTLQMLGSQSVIGYADSILTGNGILLPDGQFFPDAECGGPVSGYVSSGNNLLNAISSCPFISTDITAASNTSRLEVERRDGAHYPVADSLALGLAAVVCIPGTTVDQTGAVRGLDPRGCDAGAVQAVFDDLFADGFETGDTSAWE